MKKILIATTMIVGALSAPVQAADVGVSVTIGQPGFYGQIDMGDFPRPALVYRQPMIIERVPVVSAPIYLRVPPGHAKHWGKHCYEFNACGREVYFVRDDWYNREYVPHYQQQHGNYRDDRGDHRDDNRGHGRGKGRHRDE